MAEFIHNLLNHSITVLGDGRHRSPQFVPKIGRHTDRVPVEFGIAITESNSFGVSEICSCLIRLKAIDQKLVPFHLAEFHLRIESRGVPVAGIQKLFRIVPAEGFKCCYKKSLTEVLTFGKSNLQLCDPLLITQVWPLVTIDADDASPRCSSIAWLYSPDLGTFPAESPSLSGCIRQLCLAREKSLRIEVDDDHRT